MNSNRFWEMQAVNSLEREQLRQHLAQRKEQPAETIEEKEIQQYLQQLAHQVSLLLLQEPTLTDCAVLVRETATCQPELVAYIVSSLPVSPAQIQSQWQGIVPKALQPKAYVPVSTIPLTDTGQVDSATLTSLEVIDSDLMQRIEQELQSLSEVDRVAVVVEQLVKSIPPLHLEDLLSHTQAITVEDSQPQAQATTPTEKIENQRCLPGATPTPEAKKLAITYGEPLHYPQDAPKTLGEVLQLAAQQSTKGIVYIRSDGSEKIQSYQQLWQDAQRILAGLKKLGLKPQDKVIFQLEHNQDFIPAFWGCVLGGFVPVPIAIAPTEEQINSTTRKLQNTWQMLGKPLVLTDASYYPKICGLSRLLHLENFQVETIDQLRDCEPDLNWHSSQPEDLAILLLTSGSTGTPKAVMQSHSSLIGRCAGTVAMNSFTQEDVSLNWFPLDHVGGIIMFHVRDVYLGCQQIHAPTELVLQEPTRWLDWISRYRATITWAPNFAYGLINEQLEKLKTQSTPTWDLSSMRFILNGGEAIVAKTARRFLLLLESYQLPTTAMHPSWGMSETSSGVTFSDSFLLNSTTDEQKFVEVGSPIPGFAVRIVDTQNQVVESETIGRVQVKGASVTSGYYQNSQANQEAFTSDGWFNTGDLGFLRQGCLTITGRQKDVIIINGLNYYCHEIEAAVEEVEGVEVSYTAACAVREPRINTDKLAIFFNTSFSDDGSLVNLLKEIRTCVVNSVGVNPDYLIPVDKEIIPKTAIGKIQRTQLSQRFLAGEFQAILKRIDILLGNANTIPDWFYRQVWQPKGTVTFNNYSLPLRNSTLIFLDPCGLGAYLCQILSEHNLPYVSVCCGADFLQISRDRYTIAPGKADHYQILLESLAADNIVIGQILHLWTYDQYISVKSLDALEQAQEQGIYSLLFLVQATAKVLGSEHGVQLLFISSHIQSVLSTDPIAYEKSTVLGLLKTIPQELPSLNCRHIDLPFDLVETNGAYILQELLVPTKEPEIAIRNGQRFVPRLEKVNLHEPKQEIPFKQRGIYLLSGGLGGVGIQIAQYLLKYYQARLLLVGRTPLPEKRTWNAHLEAGDAISQRIKAYEELQMLGGEVIYSAADICDLEQLLTIVEKAKFRWGKDLDGVIHLAGTFHEQHVVEETQENLAAVLRPKMLGTWMLHQLIKDNADSIFINFSSVNGFFGGKAVGAYAAANSFLDRFSHYQKDNSALRSYCFAWSMWDETGMSQGYQMKNLTRAKGYYAMASSQGLSSMLAGLNHDQAYLLIGLDGNNQNIRRLESEALGLQKLTAYFTANSSSSVVKLADCRVQDRFGTHSTCNLVQLLEMPLTLSGAIDRDELVRRFIRHEAGEYVAPRNQVERKIAQIWQQVLGTPQISIHDNFFELGGNSLLASQLISRLRDAFSVELSLQRLFASPTVADLADNLEALRTTAEEGGALITAIGKETNLPLVPVSRDRNLPLSFTQESAWGANQFLPHSSFLILSFCIHFTGCLNVKSLNHSLNEIVQRHESLRTNFAEVDGSLVQIITHNLNMKLPVVDLHELPNQARDKEAQRLATEESERSFDLACDPLVRFTLLRLQDEKSVLLVNIHHIILDGWSMNIFMRELMILYKSFSTGLPSPLQELPIQYADFAIWQREQMRALLEKQVAYWKQQLGGNLTMLNLPADRPRPPVPSFQIGTQICILPNVLTQKLKALSKREGVTLFVILLAALKTLLYHYTEQPDILVTVPVASRSRTELEGLIGFFSNTLIIRTELSLNSTFKELSSQLQQVTNSAYTHQELPFSKLLEELEWDLIQKPILQVWFNMISDFSNLDDNEVKVPGLEVESQFMYGRIGLSFDLFVIVSQQKGLLHLAWSYSKDLFDATTIDRMAGNFQLLLENIVANPQQQLSNLHY